MMTILVYDVHTRRVAKIRGVCTQFLTRTQRSVFEGELTDASYEKLKKAINGVIDRSYDRVTVYRLGYHSVLRREDLGLPTRRSAIL